MGIITTVQQDGKVYMPTAVHKVLPETAGSVLQLLLLLHTLTSSLLPATPC